MNWHIVKGTVLVVLAGLYLTAGAILLIGNSGDPMDLWMYNQILDGVSTGAVLFFAAAAGAVATGMIWLLIRGIKNIRRGRLEKRLFQARHNEKSETRSE